MWDDKFGLRETLIYSTLGWGIFTVLKK